MKKIKVIRTICMEGPEDWIRATLDNSVVGPGKNFKIRTFKIGYPEEQALISEISRTESEVI